MKTWLERSQRMLELPLELRPRFLLVLVSLLIGLSSRLVFSEIESHPANLGTSRWISFALGALGLLALRAAAIGKIGALVDLWVLYIYFLAFAAWSFARWPQGESAGLLKGSSYALLAVALVLTAALGLAWREGRAAEATDARVAG